ncbi:MAG TPA: phospholipase D-like domain-containing protein [Thermoanaerobaculia bacterium]|jgi:phosphatidylserine/phosphatidylglycerophosphate/cardiolipin synthase-like enzyme|nr:phospholipase D-like domain-containing protein [Thermoanaerobaculia bacterium]
MRLRTLVLLCLLATPAAAQEVLELVESVPVETTLDHPDLRDAYVVWPEMIDRAQKTLDFAEFYASDDPANKQSRLETVTQAVERAAARGVNVRFLAEKVFQKTYPELLARLGAKPGIEVRIYDFAAIAGGVLHAKYFLVDGREVYVGSQNFDWRSLQHIQELGARVAEPGVARAFLDVFETDWALAGGGDKRNRTRSNYLFPAAVGEAQVTPVFSPTGWLPDPTLWDLPRLVEMIDRATRTVRVQLLTYKTTARDGSYFDALDAALRRAASRGVQVQLLLADWSKRKGTIEGLQSLQVTPGIDVRMSTIPPFSGGFVPFGRVGHAKYMVVDGRRAWIGTGNWEGDYFTQSRNAGLVIDSPRYGERLDRYFADAWGSTYAYDVDACATYEPPRTAE